MSKWTDPSSINEMSIIYRPCPNLDTGLANLWYTKKVIYPTSEFDETSS